jgi:hypothetical protein
MSKHTITSKIGGTLTSRLLLLEGQTINLNPDGSSTKTIEVIGPLNIAVLVEGVPGTEWTVKISEGEKELSSAKKTIKNGINDSFTDTVTLLPAPAAAKKAGAVSLRSVKGGARAAGAKKGGAKKAGSKKGASKKGASKKGGAKKGAEKSGKKGGGR